LAPPPSRTASFSRMRSPGVVLRVQTILALCPSIASTRERVAVATPDRTDQVQGGALGGQHRPCPAGNARDRLAALDAAAIRRKPLDLEARVQQLEREKPGFEAGDDAGLPRRHNRLDAGVLRHHRIRGDVAGAAQILGQRGADDRLDQQAQHRSTSVRHVRASNAPHLSLSPFDGEREPAARPRDVRPGL